MHNRVETEIQPRTPFPIFFDIPTAFKPLKRRLSGNKPAVCGIMGVLGLLSDGSYALCGIGQNLPELVFGTAGQGALNNIWTSHPVLESIRKGIPNDLQGICGRCLMKSVCLGACLAQNYYRSHDLMGEFWFCQEAEQEGFFPVTRLRP